MTTDPVQTLKQLRRRQRDAAERLLADSRLRAALTDEQAGQLLDWALDFVHDRLIVTADMPEAEADIFADGLVTAVRRTMRRFNQLVTDLAGLSQEEASEQVDLFLADLGQLIDVPPGARAELLVDGRSRWDEAAVFQQLMGMITNEEEE